MAGEAIAKVGALLINGISVAGLLQRSASVYPGGRVKLGRCAATLVVLVTGLWCAPGVEAQDKPKPAAQTQKKPKTPLAADTNRWEIEFKVRLGTSVVTADGAGSLPGAGAAFTTVGNSETRRVTSWLFGDGASLLNDVLASLGRPERVLALDALLNSAAVEHSTDNGFGVRISRRLRKNLWIEVDGDYSRATFALLPSIVPGLLDTHESFANAFSGLVASAQGAAFFNPALDSQVLTGDGEGHEVVLTGALRWEFGGWTRLKFYLLGGGGIAWGMGGARAVLAENYSFGLPSGARIDETDTVNMDFSGGIGLVATGGGGMRFRVTRGSGVRVDVRALLVQNHVNTLVSTTPTVLLSQPADAIWSSLTPGIQFSTDPAHDSNLSAPALSQFKALSGSGFKPRYALSLGYYFTF